MQCVQHEKPFGGMMHKNVPLKVITPIPLGLNADSIAKDRRKRTAAAQAGMDGVDSAGANKRAKSDGSPTEQFCARGETDSIGISLCNNQPDKGTFWAGR